MCELISLDIASDVLRMRAYVRGRAYFNRSAIARRRGMKLGLCAVRAHYARWKLCPSPSCFESRWGLAGKKAIIGPEHARELALRAIEKRMGGSELFQRLKAEIPNLPFSRATLMRALPTTAMRKVRLANQSLLKAEREAIQSLSEGVA